MKQANQDPGYIFHATDKYVIGTQRVIGTSDRTIDISLEALATNYDLQTALGLASAALLRPHFRPPVGRSPLEGKELLEYVAFYLSSLPGLKGREQRRAYLMGDGRLRLLITDKTLRKDIEKELGALVN